MGLFIFCYLYSFYLSSSALQVYQLRIGTVCPRILVHFFIQGVAIQKSTRQGGQRGINPFREKFFNDKTTTKTITVPELCSLPQGGWQNKFIVFVFPGKFQFT